MDVRIIFLFHFIEWWQLEDDLEPNTPVNCDVLEMGDSIIEYLRSI